jgi:DNA primase
MELAVATYGTHLDDAASYLTGRGLTKQTAASFRLGHTGPRPAEGHPTSRLAIPYLTAAGVNNIKFRCITCAGKCDGHGKYLYQQGAGHQLFNVPDLFRPDQTIVLVEGELDCMTVVQATGMPCVAYPGVKSWTNVMARCFAGWPQVFVVADGDEPGRDAAKSVADDLRRYADDVRVVRLDDDWDMNRILCEQGAETIRELLA